MTVQETDASPVASSCTNTLNVSNGTLTDNGDGTFTLTTGGGGGDSITVNATAATNANFLDNIYIDWTLDTAPTPDDITAKLDYTQTLAGNPAFAAGEVALTTSGTTGGVLFEGAADTIEGLLQWAPTTADRTVTIQDSTHTLVGRDTTDTLTNKTIDATNTVTIDVTDINAAASATWAGQVSNETGTGLWTFNSGPTLTGTVLVDSSGTLSAGGAVSFGIVTGTNPTVTDAGRIAVDQTDDQFLYGQGGNTRVVPYEHSVCAMIENLAAADDNMELYMANDAITATAVGCHCRGTCTTAATLQITNRGNTAMTGTPTCSTGTTRTTFTSLSGTATALSAGNAIRFNVTNTPNPETDEYTICATYTVDRQ